MPAGARLLLVEAIVPERAHDGPEAVRMDLHMLILLGARSAPRRSSATCSPARASTCAASSQRGPRPA
jgi:hypothetical protein